MQPLKFLDKEQEATVRRLWASSMSDVELANMVGQRTTTLRRIARDMGLPLSRQEARREAMKRVPHRMA